MSVLNGFELYDDSNKKFFITLRNVSVMFSKTIVDALKNAPYVHMYLDRENKRVAFKPCEKDEAAIEFYKQPKQGKPVITRFAGRKAEAIMEIIGRKMDSKGEKFYGEYFNDEELVIINLKDQEDQQCHD